MPLEPYQRGKTWWAKGRIEVDGKPITGYIRTSTGASTEAGARRWVAERVEAERRRDAIGADHAERLFNFNDAVLLYGTEDLMTARRLKPIADKLGDTPVMRITPKMVTDLGPELYPEGSTETWRRWVVNPTRAVINNANALGKCPPIRIKGYSKAVMVTQDKKRGKPSRVTKTPGSWPWLLAFMAAANHRLAAMAMLMFTTGARVGQAIAMTPAHLAPLDRNRVVIPGAKGHEDREVEILPELAKRLRALPPLWPRFWRRVPSNQRVFGYADRNAYRSAWKTACKLAGIEPLMAHAAGRHGFGQEMRVRQGVDTKAIEKVGGWSPKGNMVDRTYTHAEGESAKVLAALKAGQKKATRTKSVQGRKTARPKPAKMLKNNP